MQNHKLKFHSCCFFKFSNFCKISRVPAITLHSDNKFPSCCKFHILINIFHFSCNLYFRPFRFGRFVSAVSFRSFRWFRWFRPFRFGRFVSAVSFRSFRWFRWFRPFRFGRFVSFRSFRWFRWFRPFRFGRFVSTFRLLVHAFANNTSIKIWRQKEFMWCFHFTKQKLSMCEISQQILENKSNNINEKLN